jgi:hypothetical protein
MDALSAYLDNRDDLKEIRRDMIEAARTMLAGDEELKGNLGVESQSPPKSETAGDRADAQLRLL